MSLARDERFDRRLVLHTCRGAKGCDAVRADGVGELAGAFQIPSVDEPRQETRDEAVSRSQRVNQLHRVGGDSHNLPFAFSDVATPVSHLDYYSPDTLALEPPGNIRNPSLSSQHLRLENARHEVVDVWQAWLEHAHPFAGRIPAGVKAGRHTPLLSN